ncbi:MAG: glycosyltransferase family 2 protein [Prevotella sp.]|nr:glycosyltransferase family 2 protein [Prevotella sp.]
MSSLYIVMPAYNEEANIEKTVSEWHPVAVKVNEIINCKLVIANDGSKDNTHAKLLELKNQYPLLEPLDKSNSGHGATVLFLYRYAIEHGADYIFQTDSDGQTNPDEFWQFFENRDKYDFQIGNRNHREDGASRVFVTKTLRIVVWLMFHEWVIDANTPFRLMAVNRLKPILEVIPQDFFLCNVAISAIAVKWHERCKWYPITFKPRQGGINSINMKRIFKIGMKAIGDFRLINNNLK